MDDFLSVFFLFIIILIAIPVSVYSTGYIKKYRNIYSGRYFWIMFGLFVLSMIGVVMSSNSISFMVFWELMSIASFFLAIYDHKNRESIKPGIYYFVLTHISGLFLMMMFGFIYKYTGSIDFTEIVHSRGMIQEPWIIFILALIGFGAKAGLLVSEGSSFCAIHKFPSMLSAMMSGVMLKVAIYGFIRVTFFLMGGVSWESGLAVMLLGTVFAIYNIINALLQNDNKKLLAYSSSENIGVIFSVIGLALVLYDLKLYEAAIMALTAGLFHSLNHGVFKSLLFTGAGSALFATGTSNMNELGGLHAKMKFTAICVFIGTAAISCIPPLNGFASESLILVSFIKSSFLLDSKKLFLVVILCGCVIMLASGAAIFAAVKAFGITYLGKARSEKAVNVREIPRSMNVGMAMLSALSILFGIFSPFIVGMISIGLSESILETKYIVQPFGYEITRVAILLFGIIILILLVSRILDKGKKPQINSTWGCGFDTSKPNMQYSGDGFSQPVARYFGRMAGYKKESKVKDTILLKQKTTDKLENNIYMKLIYFTNFLAVRVVKIHYGKIQLYVAYILVAVILSLILVINFV
ncbi:proton-conducting transporter transmembrane domain-containing protein [Parasporobacterium paucivorans]|nr:proton-conducting transporter membrane subunit [Parasporobacterium paucivorans]